jgi:hypothetical protein
MNRVRWTCVAAMWIVLLGGSYASSASLTPFGGAPISLPGAIPAANFDNGGEGIAYHDTTTGNTGGQYRSTDVDVQASSEGGYAIGWIATGEWLNYTVSVGVAGNYTASLRIAAPASGGSLHIGFNGPSSVWKTVAIPATGGWQTWTNVTVPVTLGAGTQQLTLRFDVPGFNISSIAVTGAGGTTTPPPTTSGLTPFSGTPAAIPGVVQAAQFDNGGEGIGYHDTTPGNSGGAFRSTDVDIEASTQGGFDIGWIAAGEWLNYTINVGAAGNYVVQVRVASPNGASFHVGFNGPSQGQWKAASAPASGGWQSWTTVSVPVTLGAGTQQMTLMFDTAGMNLANMTLASEATTTSSGGSTPPGGGTTGTTLTVNAGGDFQGALNRAQPGDTIVLQAGATFTGNFILPAKSSGATSYITVTTSAASGSLPGSNARITPAYASMLPKIKSPNTAQAIATAPFAHHYRLEYLELLANVQGQGDILDFGDGSSNQNTLAVVPHDLIADHLYIHGDPVYGQKRGIGLNSASTAITNSYISSIMANAQDSQAICGWNGPGPYTITNNYLEGAAENILFGGADPAIPQLVPSDITIARNYVTKQLAWRGSVWNVKNLLEFKNAQRVVVDGNVFEYNWLAAQTGYSILFTPRNQDGNSPWSIVQQIQFTNNIVRHVSSAINILGVDYTHPSLQTNAITIRNNIFEDISGAAYGGDGRFVLITGGAANITIDHNTVLNDGSSDLFADGPAVAAFTFTNNIMSDHMWAIIGTSSSPGNGTVSKFFPGSLFQDNVIAGAPASTYPTGNFYPSLLSSISFINLAGGNYRLSSSSSYRNAGTDGKDIGADINAINAAAGTSY